MAAKLTRLAQKIAILLHLVAQSCTICRSRFRRPVRKLLDTHSYIGRTVWREKTISLFTSWIALILKSTS